MAPVAGAATEAKPALAAPPEPPRGPAEPKPQTLDTTPLVALAAFVGGLVVYGLTAAPGVQGGDSGEFQFVGHILGLPHPPGYPLFALVSKLWTLLVPVGEVARRVNLLSAVCAAGALGAVAWAGSRVAGPRPAGAAGGLVAAAWLALAPSWWGQATIASVRPLTGFFLAALLAALASYGAGRRPATLYAAAAIFGFGLTHHVPSLAPAAPVAALYVLTVDPGIVRRPGQIGKALLAAVLPLLVYLYLPIRSAMGASFDASHPTTVRAFLDLVTARGFAGDMLFFDPLSVSRLEMGRQILLTNVGAFGLVLAALGAVATLATRPRWFILTAGVAAVNLYISLSYRAPVIADYLIPTYVVLGLWVGALAALIARPWAPLALLGLLLGAPPLLYAAEHWSSFDRSRDTADERFLRDAFATAAPNSTILTDWEHATVLWYGQFASGQRPDVVVEYVAPRGAEVPWLASARAALARGPVYATGLDPRLGRELHLQRVGPLYQALVEPSTDVPAGLTESGLRFGDAIELVGYRVEPAPRDADVSVTLAWRALQPLGRDVSEFVHVVQPDGKVWGQRDGVPGEGLYPTSRWMTGEIVVERYSFAVSDAAPRGELELEVGWYEAGPGGSWKRFEARRPDGSPAGDAPRIARVGLPARPAPRTVGPAALLERATRSTTSLATDWARPGSGQLEPGMWRVARAVARYDPPIPLGHSVLLTGAAWDRVDPGPGDEVAVALDLLPLDTIREDEAVFVHLVDPSGQMRAQKDSVPVDGGLPTLRWAPGRPVRDVRTVVLPPDAPEGRYTIRVGMYAMSTGAHLPVLDDARAKAGQGDFVEIGELDVRLRGRP